MTDNDETATTIATLAGSLTISLDAASDDGFGITLYILPSHTKGRDSPQLGVRLSKLREPCVSEDVIWIGMPVPNADED